VHKSGALNLTVRELQETYPRTKAVISVLHRVLGIQQSTAGVLPVQRSKPAKRTMIEKSPENPKKPTKKGAGKRNR